MDDYGRVTHGGKADGSVESGTIKVKKAYRWLYRIGLVAR
jgi:hypothetical protein